MDLLQINREINNEWKFQDFLIETAITLPRT